MFCWDVSQQITNPLCFVFSLSSDEEEGNSEEEPDVKKKEEEEDKEEKEDDDEEEEMEMKLAELKAEEVAELKRYDKLVSCYSGRLFSATFIACPFDELQCP